MGNEIGEMILKGNEIMEVQLESWGVFILCSHSDLWTVINKELLIIHYTMYCFKIDPGFSDFLRFDSNLFDSKSCEVVRIRVWPLNITTIKSFYDEIKAGILYLW